MEAPPHTPSWSQPSPAWLPDPTGTCLLLATATNGSLPPDDNRDPIRAACGWVGVLPFCLETRDSWSGCWGLAKQKVASEGSRSHGQHLALCSLVWGPPGGPEAGGGGGVSSGHQKQDRLRVGWPEGGLTVSDCSHLPRLLPGVCLGVPGEPPQTQLELLLRGGQDIKVGTRTPQAASPDTAGAVLGEPQGVWEMVGAQQSLV